MAKKRNQETSETRKETAERREAELSEHIERNRNRRDLDRKRPGRENGLYGEHGQNMLNLFERGY